MSLTERSLRELSEMMINGKLHAMELLNMYLEAALKGSCITFCNDAAFEAAKTIDERRLYGQNFSPIGGFPYSLKDNINTREVRTTCNSRSLKSNIAVSNAFVVDRLNELGAILTAKNCMREFSVGKIEDSAYELRSYLNWAGTNKNINIGAFSIGTDIGLCEFFCGLWTFKPALRAEMLSDGVFSGAPSLEKTTYSARRADDLRFLYPFLCGDDSVTASQVNYDVSPPQYRILVYDNLNMPDYIVDFLKDCGFSVTRSDCMFIDKAELIYDCVLATEFFTTLYKIGMSGNKFKDDVFIEAGHMKSRSEGMGFETKRLILTGAHLLSSKNKENTLKIISSGKAFANELKGFLGEYDFIAAPALYGDKLSKASAVACLPEVTVPYGDVLPFKLIALPERERLLLDIAVFLEERL